MKFEISWKTCWNLYFAIAAGTLSQSSLSIAVIRGGHAYPGYDQWDDRRYGD